jgi:Tol biopolymer transport system component
VRPARALFWACPLYVVLLAVLVVADPGPMPWLAAGLLAGAVVLLLHRGGLLRRRPRVYLSHRRSDSAAEAAGAVAALRRRYGTRAVVVGPPSVRPGAKLHDEVRRAVGRCDAVCVVIGPDWTASRDTSGRRRLSKVRDPVRVEVEAALHSGGAVVPVLVRGAEAPDVDDLPETMRGLAAYTPVVIAPGPGATRHAELLARLEPLARPGPGGPARRGHRLVLTALVVVLAAPFGISLVRGATAGVGDLDEPAVAPDGVRVVAVVRGGLWARPMLRIWNSLTGATEAEYRFGAGEPAAGALAWSPDGRAVAVGGDDGSLVLRRADTLAAIRTLTGYRGSFRATGVGWSPDGLRLAAVDGTGMLRVWRAEDGAPVGAVPVFATYTGRVEWSPRSDAVAVRCTDENGVAVVELPGDEPGPVRRLAGSGPATSVAWAPDGESVAAGFSAAPHLVVFRRAADGFTAQTVAGQDARAGAVAWSPDGAAVASASEGPAGDGVVRVFDGRTTAPTSRFPSGSALAQNPVWAPDGTAVAVADGTGIVTVRVHEAANGAVPSRWESPQQPYGSRVLAWTVDDRVVTAGGRDHVVRVWQPGTAQAVAEWSVSWWELLLP